MKKLLLIEAIVFCVFSWGSAQNLRKEGKYAGGEIIVHFQEGVLDHSQFPATASTPLMQEVRQAVKRQDILKALQDEGITGMRKLMRQSAPDKRTSVSRSGEEVPIPDFHNLMRLYVPENVNIEELCQRISRLPGIRYAEPNYVMHRHDFTPNDIFINSQKYLYQSLNNAHINVRRAWDFSLGSSNVKVGILDGGINYGHSELGGSFGPSAPKVKGGYDYDDGDTNPNDLDGHGTSVAGIIGAFTNNGAGVAGIAGGNSALGNPGVQLYALKVIDDGGTLLVSDAAEAIYDGATSTSAGGYGCHILNLSGGYKFNQITNSEINSLRKAVSYAAHNGAVFVASKGNDGISSPNYPSDYRDNLVLSVGASNNSDSRDPNSNYGNDMDFVAPGTSDLVYTTGLAQTYQSFSLTSASAAVVSGIAALLKSININLHRDDVEKLMEISADKVGVIPYVNGYNQEMGYGRVNAGRALEYLHAPWVLQHHTATGGTAQKITSGSGEGLTFLNDAGNALAEGWYFGEMHQVTKTVTLPVSACGQRFVWTRNVGATQGWSAANPNNNLGYSFIVSENATTATLRTFVYYIKHNVLGQTINAWYPCAPQNVSFAYTTLTSQPYPTQINGPSLICTSGSYTVSGLAAGTTVTWSDNSTGLIINTSGVATRQNGFNGPVTVTATTTSSCGSSSISKVVWVGAPVFTNFDITAPPFTYPPGTSFTVCPSGNVTLYPRTSYTGTFLEHQWQASGSYSYLGPLNSSSLFLTTSPMIAATFDGNYRARNICGWSAWRLGRLTNMNCEGGEEPEFVYPNPATDKIVISTGLDATTPLQTGALITIRDESKIVYSKTSYSDKESISLKDLPNGLYYIEIITSQGKAQHRLLKK